VRDVRKRFGSLEVLKGVSTVIRPRDVVVIIGPSGGKSTLPRTINGLEPIDGGRIEFVGTPAGLVAARSSRTGEHLAAYAGA
jgi:polar amino acid transport system ATP-binding protein